MKKETVVIKELSRRACFRRWLFLKFKTNKAWTAFVDQLQKDANAINDPLQRDLWFNYQLTHGYALAKWWQECHEAAEDGLLVVFNQQPSDEYDWQQLFETLKQEAAKKLNSLG